MVLRWMRAVPNAGSTKTDASPASTSTAAASPKSAGVRRRARRIPTTTRETCIVIAEAAFQPSPPMIRRPARSGPAPWSSAASGSLGRRFDRTARGLSRGGRGLEGAGLIASALIGARRASPPARRRAATTGGPDRDQPQDRRGREAHQQDQGGERDGRRVRGGGRRSGWRRRRGQGAQPRVAAPSRGDPLADLASPLRLSAPARERRGPPALRRARASGRFGPPAQLGPSGARRTVGAPPRRPRGAARAPARAPARPGERRRGGGAGGRADDGTESGLGGRSGGTFNSGRA